jgi:hypothetical protein
MKRITAIALLAIANLAMAGTSLAQSAGVKANVPFDFTVANNLLPAGTYTMKTESTGLIVIRNNDKPAIVVLTLVDLTGNKSRSGGKLTFHRYGDQYFLSEILCDWASMNVTVPRSEAEKTVLLQQAMDHPTTEVFIAAR